jgi:anaerobic magnesium-protoporphyrin IX monomethyl ester cyclase
MEYIQIVICADRKHEMGTNIKRVVLCVLYHRVPAEEIGICSISSYLRQNGYIVKIIGAKYQDIDLESIVDFQPDVIGATVYDETACQTMLLLEELNTLLPDRIQCLGGCTATFHDIGFLEKYPFIDYVIKGEGELSFLKLLQSIEAEADVGSIDGLSFRKNGTRVH